MGLLNGKTALITGAARGIGKAIALKFASEGANVAFTDLVIDENGKATEKEIEALGVKVKGYASNAADFAQRVNWSEEKQQYVMLGVTGPNEYENNVNNNFHTNRIVS